MRISAYSPSYSPALTLSRVTELPVEAAAPLSDRYPQQKPSARPLAERVVEGEILPRPAAAHSLLDDSRAYTLAAVVSRSAATANQTSPTAAHSQLLFYLLHSSSENLTGSNVGQLINQTV